MNAFPAAAWLLCCTATLAQAEAFNPRALPVPAGLAVADASAPALQGVQELKFGDTFKRPVGPKGLEPTARLIALDGQRVHLVGFMVARETATPGQFILSPVPVLLGDEDESFSDDLPPSAVFVHLPPALRNEAVPNLHGLMQVTGTLHVGAHDEDDGRVSALQLDLDEATASLLPLAPH